MNNETAEGLPNTESQKIEYAFVEENVRLSDSRIWKFLEDYYQNASISAWNQIPFYPTSNPFIADCYADLIISFLNDYAQHLDFEKPLYILEMAAGSGCFSFYLLRELKKRRKYFEHFRKLKLRYIMADFTVDNPSSWLQNPKLKPFLDEGILEFAVFSPMDDRELRAFTQNGLEERNLLEKDDCLNPLIAIANYFFDSIKQDAFQIQDGKLYEARHNFKLRKDFESKSSEFKFEKLEKHENYLEAARDFYDDARLNDVLKSYCRDFENASLIFPLGAFKCISNLLEISKQKLVLISSDKGFTDKNYVKGRREQPFVAHHGIFSYSVNYDAIRRYFEAIGGVSLNTSDDNLSVSSAVNYFVKDKDFSLEESRYNFEEKFDRQNLPNYLYFMQDILTEVEPKKSSEILRACMGYVALCNYDPIVFCLAAPRIYFALETLNSLQEKRLLEILERVRENFFSVQQQYDVFYWIGRIYYGMNRLDDALKAFADSMLTFGESSSALYYMAACYEVKKDYKTALRMYEDTLRLEPDCEFTKSGIKRVQEYLTPQ
ncbi:MAG: hypothetical protein K2X27_20475 [Candidatus Obscuribacterales bacterium]|nr:hypothetical protein [Candidatus Obscuribacterales bacterium]